MMKHLALLIIAGLLASLQPAPAQDYPARQITLIAPWPAGGAVDALCRAIAPPLAERLGKSVVVENRPGAGSVIGTAAGAPALTDVVAGHVPLLFSEPVPALPLIREGKVRALGVSTMTRSPSAPDIAPIAAAGVPGFDAAGWGVISVPAGTPKEIVGKL